MGAHKAIKKGEVYFIYCHTQTETKKKKKKSQHFLLVQLFKIHLKLMESFYLIMFKAHNNTQLQIQIKPSLKNGFEDSL